MGTKIDITSTTLEKGIDLAKEFLEKLILPTVEETGLLIADNIKSFRFKNQIRILTKAQEVVRQNNIEIKKISFKTLVPLLEYSSLEEDESLQEKWVNLLINFIDSNGKYESSIFPFILNQLTSQEAIDLEKFTESVSTSAGKLVIDDIGIANLIRLGLIRQLLPQIEARQQTSLRRSERIVVNYSKRDHHYTITQLGKKFLECCNRK